MRVRWNKRSKVQLWRIIQYLSYDFGYNKAEKFMQEVENMNMLLADNPYIGMEEPLLADMSSSYRSIVVCRFNKIVYRIVNDNIEVVAFWNTRREPIMQAKQLKIDATDHNKT